MRVLMARPFFMSAAEEVAGLTSGGGVVGLVPAVASHQPIPLVVRDEVAQAGNALRQAWTGSADLDPPPQNLPRCTQPDIHARLCRTLCDRLVQVHRDREACHLDDSRAHFLDSIHASRSFRIHACNRYSFN